MSHGAPETPAACRWCGEVHGGPLCPWVKALEFENLGGVERVIRVEFFSALEQFGPRREQAAGAIDGNDYPKLGG